MEIKACSQDLQHKKSKLIFKILYFCFVPTNSSNLKYREAYPSLLEIQTPGTKQSKIVFLSWTLDKPGPGYI